MADVADNTTTARLSPVRAAGLPPASAVAAGDNHSLALGADGQVWAWGANAYGQVGDATSANNRPVPVAAAGLDDVVAIAAGSEHSLAIDAGGQVWAWGRNREGQLGDGSTTSAASPQPVAGMGDVVAIATGASHSLALGGDGTMWAWGQNNRGQLGDGTTTARTQPIQVQGLGPVVSIAAGTEHSLAIDDDGRAWAWGRNSAGQLGDGTTTNRGSPVAVAGVEGATTTAAGIEHSLARGSDGQVLTWGANRFGQRGDGTTTGGPEPSTVVGLAASEETTYSYVGDGLRASKTTGGTTTTFTWDRSGPLALLASETTGNTTTHYLYGAGNRVSERIGGEETSFYHHDQLGSVIAVTDQAGAVLSSASYDAYGNLTAASGEDQPIGFAGEYTVAESGLIYLRARYYDPATAQFLTRDPLEALTGEAYAYAGNDPLNATDPLGLWGIRIGPISIGNDGCVLGTNPDGSCRGGGAVEFVEDLCFESWQEAATCAAVVAGTVSLGAGTVAVLGGTAGLTGAAAATSTYSGYIAVSAQAALTIDDCSRAVDGSCVINSASLALGGFGLGAAAGAGALARGGSELAMPFAGFGLAAGFGSFTLGFPGVGGYVDGDC